VLRQFVEAVLAFSEHPQAETIERYLAASRSLEEAQRPRRGQRSPARKNATATAA
jgi:hypothetical protein